MMPDLTQCRDIVYILCINCQTPQATTNFTSVHNFSPVRYLINEPRAHRWSRSLGSQPACDLVINPVVGCHYFLPGQQLSSQPKRSLPLSQYQVILIEAYRCKQLAQGQTWILKMHLFSASWGCGAFVTVWFLCIVYQCSYLLSYLLIYTDTRHTDRHNWKHYHLHWREVITNKTTFQSKANCQRRGVSGPSYHHLIFLVPWPWPNDLDI